MGLEPCRHRLAERVAREQRASWLESLIRQRGGNGLRRYRASVSSFDERPSENTDKTRYHNLLTYPNSLGPLGEVLVDVRAKQEMGSYGEACDQFAFLRQIDSGLPPCSGLHAHDGGCFLSAWEAQLYARAKHATSIPSSNG